MEEEDEDDEGAVPVNGGGKTDKYEWTQSLAAVEVTIPLRPGLKSKDVKVDMKMNSLKVSYRD